MKKIPCAVCGDLRWPSQHPGAPENPTCRKCQKVQPCGSLAAYRRGCRCAPCRQAKNAAMRAYKATRPAPPKAVRTCDQCGGEFNPRSNQVRCSPECVRAWRAGNKARRRGAGVVSRVDPAAIYERDGWTCGICELPVDPAESYPNPGSASLDHVVPIAHGGAHAPENVQLAHLYCNWVKGPRLEAAC